MNFGFTLFFRNPPPAKVSFAELYRKEIELAVAAEELGYDTVWLTEHHFVDDGYAPSLLPIAAAIAARTKKIRIGTFVLLLPLHNALRVAEDAATVDLISNGRLDLGLGQGYRVPEFVGFNIPRNERGPRLEEGTEVIRRVWTERNVTMDGRFNKLTNVTVIPGPVQKPHPPIVARRARAQIDRTRRAQRLPFHGHRRRRSAADVRRGAQGTRPRPRGLQYRAATDRLRRLANTTRRGTTPKPARTT